MSRVSWTLLAATLTLVGGAGVVRLGSPEDRPRDLDGLRAERAALRFEERFAGMASELESAREEIFDLRAALSEGVPGVEERVERLELSLATTARQLQGQAQVVEELNSTPVSIREAALEGRLEELSKDWLTTWHQLVEQNSETQRLVAVARLRLDELQHDLLRDPDRLWTQMVGPSVQLSGESTVGSGVLVRDPKAAAGDQPHCFVLTAWHVVRDIQAGLDRVDTPVPIRIYSEDGAVIDEEATLVRFDADIDVALLSLTTELPQVGFAAMPHPARLEDVRIFHEVYAVGCPLGNDPIPTYGEISDTRHLVDGDEYWMISAPTYIGNSGGGIFDATNGDLLGIFSKIYTHGSVRPTVVPHMGLATPMQVVYDWLQDVDYGYLVP